PAPCHTKDPALVSLHARNLGPAQRIPDLHESVRTDRSHALPQWTPGQPTSTTLMGLEITDFRRLPQFFNYADSSVLGGDSQLRPVRAPCHRPDVSAVGGKGVNLCAA